VFTTRLAAAAVGLTAAAIASRLFSAVAALPSSWGTTCLITAPTLRSLTKPALLLNSFKNSRLDVLKKNVREKK